MKLQKATRLFQGRLQGDAKRLSLLLGAMKEASDQQLPGTPQPGDPLPGRGNQNFSNSDSALMLVAARVGHITSAHGAKGPT